MKDRADGSNKDKRENVGKEKKKGPVIPAGTEQETGLTRGQTEKPPVIKKEKPGSN